MVRTHQNSFRRQPAYQLAESPLLPPELPSLLGSSTQKQVKPHSYTLPQSLISNLWGPMTSSRSWLFKLCVVLKPQHLYVPGDCWCPKKEGLETQQAGLQISQERVGWSWHFPPPSPPQASWEVCAWPSDWLAVQWDYLPAWEAPRPQQLEQTISAHSRNLWPSSS